MKLKKKSGIIICFNIFCFLFITSVWAETIAVQFEGVVSSNEVRGTICEEWGYEHIPLETAVRGTFSYSTPGTDDYPSDPSFGSYSDSPISMKIWVGDQYLESSEDPGDWIQVINDSETMEIDHAQFTYYHTSDMRVQMMLILNDDTMTVFSDDSIPTILNSDDFGSKTFYLFFSSGCSGDMTVDVTALSLSTQNIIDFIEESTLSGLLRGDGPTDSAARGRFRAFRNMIESADALISSGDYDAACVQLLNAYNRCDGDFPPPDFVAGVATTELSSMIFDLMGFLGCE